MTNQRILTTNIRQVFLGISSDDEDAEIIVTPQRRSPAADVSLFLVSSLGILIVIFWVIPLVFINQPKVQANLPENIVALEQKTSFFLPIRLKIKSLNIDAPIEPVGFTVDGAMDTPSEAANVAWLSTGPSPGEIGSAVITGHLDGADGAAGVFQKLHLLKVGDEISVIDDNKISRTFIVVESRMYNFDEDVPEVFYSTNGRYLNLITCSGAWSSLKGKFEQRLVVFAVLKP